MKNGIDLRRDLKFKWSVEQMTVDKEDGMTKEERTFEKVWILASGLVQGIEFTNDLPDRHQTGRVPMLDIEVWKEAREGREATLIRHSY